MGPTGLRKIPQTSPPPRTMAAMAYDSVINQTVLFGGIEGVVSHGEIQTRWRTTPGFGTVPIGPQQQPPSSPPGGQSLVIAFDSTHDQVILWNNIEPNDTNITSTMWTWYGGPTVVTRTAPPPPSPAPSITTVVSASAFGAFTASRRVHGWRSTDRIWRLTRGLVRLGFHRQQCAHLAGWRVGEYRRTSGICGLHFADPGECAIAVRHHHRRDAAH